MTPNTTVLICDDAENMRLLVRAVLESCGYTIMESSNGREGLEQVALHQPDLLILDLKMPELGGLDVLAELADQPRRRPKILVLSSEVLDATEQEAILRHADALVSKPFRTDDLRARVRELISGS